MRILDARKGIRAFASRVLRLSSATLQWGGHGRVAHHTLGTADAFDATRQDI